MLPLTIHFKGPWADHDFREAMRRKRGERIDTALLGEVEVGLNWVESVTGRIWKPQMS